MNAANVERNDKAGQKTTGRYFKKAQERHR